MTVIYGTTLVTRGIYGSSLRSVGVAVGGYFTPYRLWYILLNDPPIRLVSCGVTQAPHDCCATSKYLKRSVRLLASGSLSLVPLPTYWSSRRQVGSHRGDYGYSHEPWAHGRAVRLAPRGPPAHASVWTNRVEAEATRWGAAIDIATGCSHSRSSAHNCRQRHLTCRSSWRSRREIRARMRRGRDPRR